MRLVTISLALATLISTMAVPASAGVTCQTIGQFTYCTGPVGSGQRVTCQTIGQFTYCN